jgi:FixJ family two-component response regulator
MPVIFLTACRDVSMTVEAMKAGAFEFLAKPCRDDLLLGTVRQAIELSQTEVKRQAALVALRTRHASLSPREREVMALVISGRLNKQVAGELGISEITVKAHRGRMMRKMRAGSVADLVNMAIRLRLPLAPFRRTPQPIDRSMLALESGLA